MRAKSAREQRQASQRLMCPDLSSYSTCTHCQKRMDQSERKQGHQMTCAQRPSGSACAVLPQTLVPYKNAPDRRSDEGTEAVRNTVLTPTA